MSENSCIPGLLNVRELHLILLQFQIILQSLGLVQSRDHSQRRGRQSLYFGLLFDQLPTGSYCNQWELVI